ncbi:MAG: hypothetical protein H8D87_06010 [Deltaproteobacteria bacterium]|nr:hypothetical protein [Candidatus Desulfobacula maris]
MKKALVTYLTIFLLLIPVTSIAGQYDGIWEMDLSPGDFSIARQVGDTMVIIVFDLNDSSEVFIGTMNGNVGTFTEYGNGSQKLSFTAQFTSSTTCNVVFTACSGDCISSPPMNTPYLYNKIF